MEGTSSCVASTSATITSLIDCSEDISIPTVQLRADVIDPYAQNKDLDVQFEERSTETDKPFIGMEFSTTEEAYDFYNNYAKRVGFSVRRANKTKSKCGLSSLRFVCNKEGFGKRQQSQELPIGSSNKPKTPEKVKGMTRTGCAASCRIRLINGIWKVSVFNEEHNHPLITSPSKKRNLRSHKSISWEQKQMIRDLSAQNVGSSQILEFMAAENGGKQNLQFKKQDVKNLIAARTRKLIGFDVDTTLMHFQKRLEEDPEFFFAVEPDENDAVKNIFWIDGRGRRAFKEFGDVVTFDTTYQTNKYCMPLAPFLGVNNHRHSIFFGMALLRREDATSFCWLFEIWLKAMYGKHPKTIITDQCPAMKKAIEKIFPNTIHRCCQWHVMRKAREQLGCIIADKEGLEERLGVVINRSLSITEFETRWKSMLKDYNLEDNNHLKVMFNTRSQWVPTYFRDHFFADMSTTQRSESVNGIFKIWMNNHTSIYQFVLHVEKMIEGIWQRESDEDLKTINETPLLIAGYKIEVEAREVYTRAVFSVFKEIIKESFLGFVIEVERDAIYRVDIDYNPYIPNWRPESYIVEVDKTNERVSCNCKGFEFEGLICSHAVKVMQHVRMSSLPSKYILRRWTREANASSKRPVAERSMDPGGSLEVKSARFAAIKSDLMELGEMGIVSVETFMYLKALISEGKKKLLSLVPEKETEGYGAVTEESKEVQTTTLAGEVPSQPRYLDPPQSQCKGMRKKPMRFKPTIEKLAKKMRTCSVCGAKEGHNARTCPQKGQKKQKRKIEESSEEETDEDEYDKE